MSAFYSFRYADRVCVLTDGAAYDSDGILIGIGGKVSCASSLPLAITGRGDFAEVGKMHRELFGLPWQRGVDVWLRYMRGYARVWGKQRGPVECEMLIACISELRGPEHYLLPMHHRFVEAPAFQLTLIEAADFGAGPLITMADLPEGAAATASSPDFPERCGVAIMEAMRRRPAKVPGTDRELYCIGGRVDLTTISAAGATTRTLHTWPDQIGQPIGHAVRAAA